MKDFKIEKKRGYSVIYEEITRAEVNGKRMTPEALGIYTTMMMLPDDWDYTINGLTFIVNAGPKKISRCLRELETYGYLTRKQIQDSAGLFGKMQYTIYDIRQTPISHYRQTDKGLAVNGGQVITNQVITNEVDKKKDKGENPPVLKNHYLTDLLIKKNIIEIIDLDLENYNLLFKDLDNEFGYKLVLDAARYLIDYLTKNKNINSLFNFISNSMNNNLTKLAANKKNNKPEMLNEYLTDIQNMDADNEIDKLLNEHWNNTPVLN